MSAGSVAKKMRPHITEKLLIDNDHLYQEAQTMDLVPLTLPHFFDKIILKALEIN